MRAQKSHSRGDVPPALPPNKPTRPWQVVHACDYARDIADIVEAQVSAGMRPYLLMVSGAGDVAQSVSVLQTWQDVRRWKKVFDESGAHTTPDLIHAHSFSAGMAGVRMGACLVYDLRQTIEEKLAASANAPSPWLCRSFRTAEQFVLARASAVVTHAPASREDCIARGIAPQDVFVIPDPYTIETCDSLTRTERAHVRETRSPQRIAERYDEVYRYAYMRRRKGDDSPGESGLLIPIPANL